MTKKHPAIFGLILAGGLSRRMGGGDKSLTRLGGRTLLERVAARLAPQVGALALNANGDPARFGIALPVIPDSMPDHPGPLAGVLAGLDHIAAHHPAMEWLLTAPADCPFLPADLATRLLAARGAAPVVMAASGERHHPVVALWHAGLRAELRRALEDGERRVGFWAAQQGAATVEWPAAPFDPFANVNTPDDLAGAERIIAANTDA